MSPQLINALVQGGVTAVLLGIILVVTVPLVLRHAAKARREYLELIERLTKPQTAELQKQTQLLEEIHSRDLPSAALAEREHDTQDLEAP